MLLPVNTNSPNQVAPVPTSPIPKSPVPGSPVPESPVHGTPASTSPISAPAITALISETPKLDISIPKTPEAESDTVGPSHPEIDNLEDDKLKGENPEPAGPAWAGETESLGPATGPRPIWDFGSSSRAPVGFMPGTLGQKPLCWDGERPQYDMGISRGADYGVIGEPRGRPGSGRDPSSQLELPTQLDDPKLQFLWRRPWRDLQLGDGQSKDVKGDFYIGP